MDTVELTDAALLEQLYREILEPSFPEDELIPLDAMQAGLGSGRLRGTVVLDGSDMVAGALGEWSASARAMLLAYMAIVPGRRGTGIGSTLYTEFMAAWQKRFQPCLILAEVEHPDYHPSHPVQGDPAARLRFYGRHGGRVLALPYFQPSLLPGLSRVYGMLLLALHADPDMTGTGGKHTVAAEPLRRFLTEYWTETEGEVGDDPPTVALFSALDAPGGVATMAARRYREVPVAAE